MLHEILLSLLGFTGRLVARNSDDSSFEVRTRGAEEERVQDLLTEAEEHQVSHLVRLGWYYDAIRHFIREHSPHFGSDSSFEVYKAAVVLALEDLLSEYESDVRDIESKTLVEGPLPFSFLLQSLQKYDVVFPAIWNIISETKKRHGAPLLDLLTSHQSGIPVVDSVIQRMLLRVRIVFLKQTLGWMLHGELADEGKEYFINKKQSNSGRSNESFEWTGSYHLRLEKIPESHISPRAASKVMFAGKAVNLLNVALKRNEKPDLKNASCESSSEFHTDSGILSLLDYFGCTSIVTVKEQEQIASNLDEEQNLLLENTTNSASGRSGSIPHDDFDSDGFIRDVLSTYCMKSGFASLDEMYGFAAQFQDILRKPDLTVELLEQLVDDVHDLISLRLWKVIRDEYNFFHYLQMMRNTLLLGKGEFFQSFLDELLVLISGPVPHNSQHTDKLLHHAVYRKVGRRLNIDFDENRDGSSTNALEFVVQVVSDNIYIGSKDLARFELAGLYRCAGSAECIQSTAEGKPPSISLEGNGASNRQVLRLCAAQTAPSSLTRAAGWAEHFRGQKSAKDPRTSFGYTVGCVELHDERPVSKGFRVCATFLNAWNFASCIGLEHPLFQKQISASSEPPELLLGSFCCALQSFSGRKSFEPSYRGYDPSRRLNEPRSSRVYQVQNDLSQLGLDLPGSLLIGVSFHGLQCISVLLDVSDYVFAAKVVDSLETSRVEYFARVFVSCEDAESSLPVGATAANAKHKHPTNQSGKHSKIKVIKVSQDDIQLYLCSTNEWRASPYRDVTRRSVCASSSLVLEVEYVRETVASPRPESTDGSGYQSSAPRKSVVYKLKARLREMGVRSASSNLWDIDLPLVVEDSVKARGGKCYVGLVASSFSQGEAPQKVSDASTAPVLSPEKSFHFDISSLEFHSKSSGGMQAPVATPHLSTREPLIYARLEEILGKYKHWMNLRLSFNDSLPKVFCPIFDTECLKSYSLMFTFLLKVRLVTYSLERLYLQRRKITQSGFRRGKLMKTVESREDGNFLSSAEEESHQRDRALGHLRHSMLFFLSNLFYYLQVDVIDAEYERLRSEIMPSGGNSGDNGSAKQINLRTVLQTHKNYLATVIRLSMVDNSMVQDAIERVLHSCLRLVAIHHYLKEARCLDDDYDGKISTKEVQELRRDFFSHVSYLLQIMRNVENRGFLFRVDFNGFLSQAASNIDN